MNEGIEAPVMAGPELSIVVPTFNERDNVGLLVQGLAKTLEGIQWEVVFVDDDSPDATADVIRDVALKDGRVRCIHRIGRRGLTASTAQYVAVVTWGKS